MQSNVIYLGNSILYYTFEPANTSSFLYEDEVLTSKI